MEIQGWTVTKVADPAPAGGWKNDPATENQIAFIKSLIGGKDPANIHVVLSSAALNKPLTKGQASGIIETLKALPFYKAPVAVVAAGPVECGIYDIRPNDPSPETVPGGGRWMIVYKTQTGSLRTKRLWKSWDTKSGFSWKSAGSGLIKLIQAGKITKVDIELVKKLGKDVGFCMYCGLTLSDPESKHRGYGPICAKHYGLPYGN